MSANRDLLVRVAGKVRPLLNELVFVGGAVVELYFTEPASPRVRPTTDADAICEVTGYTAYHRLGDRLRELGFLQSPRASDPPYRWRSGPDVLDVMPTDPDVLGFSNRWYAEAIRTSRTAALEPRLRIRIPTPELFLASKLAAHEGRGLDDPLTSRDLEDVVALLSNRPELPGEVRAADESLRRWVSDRVTRHLPTDGRADLIAAFLPEVRTVPGLQEEVLGRIEEMTR